MLQVVFNHFLPPIVDKILGKIRRWKNSTLRWMLIVYKHEQTQQKRGKTYDISKMGTFRMKISHQKANNFFLFQKQNCIWFSYAKLDLKGNFQPCLPAKNIVTVIFIICFQILWCISKICSIIYIFIIPWFFCKSNNCWLI